MTFFLTGHGNDDSFFSFTWLKWYSPSLATLVGDHDFDRQTVYWCKFDLLAGFACAEHPADLRNPRSDSELSIGTPLRPGDEKGDHIVVQNRWIRHNMRRRLDSYCSRRPLKLRVGTFNVNGKDPSGSLSSFVGHRPDHNELSDHHPDIFVFGFQELDLSSQALIYQATTRKEDAWVDAITEALGSTSTNYVKVQSASQGLDT